ncbi:energy transducer TonB [Lewinella cohaerens]|uniref:energy transducer TonB n=1 Tax=Lewinella cohaerens TaxID=70995 RepID=UPI00036D6D87|nr:energy transducer TonB [Lewinella cohaerens]
MYKYIFLFGFLLMVGLLNAQTDTTIYKVVEQMPRFPAACEALDTTLVYKQKCANQAMLEYVYQRVIYPQEAIDENIQGTAVVTFVVETDGRISQPQIVRDLGGGTGIAALGVVLQMKEESLRWIPGKQQGKAVRVQFNLPVRFKIKDPDPFILIGRDTVYTEFEKALDFNGGAEALQTYLDTALDYPTSGNDSCQMGQIDIQVLVEADGDVRILDVTDFNDLGFDFWYSAIDAATSTYGDWEPATYQGRKVNAAFDLSLSFLPTIATCTQKVDDFITAREVADAGAVLFNDGKIEEGIAKMTEAVTAFPNDAQLRIMRGQAYLNNSQLAEACVDLSLAKRIALVNWYDSVLTLICR